MTIEITKEILDAYYSVYPVSGRYADEGERLGIAAVLRVLIKKSTIADVAYTGTEVVVLVNDILKTIAELEQF